MSDQRTEDIRVTESPSIIGLSLFASTYERQPITPAQDPSIVDWVEKKTRWSALRLRKERIYKCGHRGPHKYEVRIWGATTAPARKIRHMYCPDCGVEELKKVAIRCCLCSLAIIPWDPVAVYDADSVEAKDFELTLLDDGQIAVGCMRDECCPSSGFFGGYWTGKDIDSPF